MNNLFIISIVAVVLMALHGDSSGGPLRGPIIGRQASMPGPIQGRPVAMRKPVQRESVSMRQPVWRSNNRSSYYNSNSRQAYTITGADLYRFTSRDFNNYRSTWGDRTIWRTGRRNAYRRDRPGKYEYH
ncbi:MAG: hypothetical protein P9M00_02395 [Candidatus Tritonobacter lacicola]|nr:hypothetical protein [Candidatus Tritonobacter lacicola]